MPSLAYPYPICASRSPDSIQSIPIIIAKPMSAQANEYGNHRLATNDRPAALGAYATSPSFASVTVAWGAMVTVLVIVIGVPVTLKLFMVTTGPFDEALELVVKGMTVDAELTKMHPFGEHWEIFGQHPPPAAFGHSTNEFMHLGGFDADIWQAHSDCDVVALQQNIPDRVKVAA